MEPVSQNGQQKEEEENSILGGHISEEIIEQIIEAVLPYSEKWVHEFIDVLKKKDVTPVIKIDPNKNKAFLMFIKNKGFESFTVKKNGIHSVLDLNEFSEAAKNKDYKTVRQLIEAIDMNEDETESENGSKENNK